MRRIDGIRRTNSLPFAIINTFSQQSNKQGICSRILTPKQVGPICWFMATFVAMFYSQRSRKILLDASDNWNTREEIFKSLKHILDDKYLKVESRESEKCIPDIVKKETDMDDFCFNFSKGNRILVYVRKDTRETSIDIDSSYPKTLRKTVT